MPVTFSVVAPSALSDAETIVFVGRAARLLSADVRAAVPPLAAAAWDDMVRRGDPGDHGRVAVTYTGWSPRRVAAAVLPEVVSRHNTPTRAGVVATLVRGAGHSGRLGVVLCVDEPAWAVAQTLAVARLAPTYTGTSRGGDGDVRVAILPPPGREAPAAAAAAAAEALRFACGLIDAPPNVLGPHGLVDAAREVAAGLPGTTLTVITGDALHAAGLGALAAVGRAATEPPALVILDHGPDADGRVCWIGKGITYDTGGLSLKQKASMPGMKTDMAGAAAVLAAFAAAVRRDPGRPLTAALAVAENAIGPTALRPDDVIRMASGRTVEVNNSDAEGRLVLGDALAWLAKHRRPVTMIALATLTGAQSVATGKRHAALYCNDAALEDQLLAAGRASGDLCHPLVFAPELFRTELASPVADLRNSPKDRQNAPSSVAGQFLLEHLEGYAGAFAHVDLAAPATQPGGRATGFGVGLLLAL